MRDIVEKLEDRILFAWSTAAELQFNAASGGLNNTGFTSVLATSKGKYLPALVTTSNGQLQLGSTAGDLWGNRNNQDNALAVNLDTTKNFVLETRLSSFPFSKNWQNAGLHLSLNQDNYIKLAAGYSGQKMIQFGAESGGAFAQKSFKAVNPGNFTSLDLRLEGTFSTKAITAYYRLNSDAANGWVSMGTLNQANVFNSGAKAGLATTNFGATQLTSSFNWFTAKSLLPDQPPPPPPPATGAPVAPTMVGVTSLSATQIRIAWNDNSNNETKFEIYRSTDGKTFSPFAGTGANFTASIDKSVQAGKQYFYKVRAGNGVGFSAFSDAAGAIAGGGVIDPPPPPPTGNTIPITIGTNLDGIAEFSPIAPFVNLATMFRPWGSIATPYQTDPSIPLTADNYPLANAGTMTYAHAYPDGAYQVSYEGQANLSFNGLSADFVVTNSANGITTGVLNIKPQTNPGTLSMFVTGVNAANPLRNLKIISPDFNPAISDTFRPVFLQKLAPFDGFMRMMDWMQANQNPIVNWNDRTSPNRFSYVNAMGVPYEVIAKLANHAKKDIWINIPVMATDDFIHKIAQLFRDQLAPDRKVYIEYSNELWAYWAHVDAMWNLNKAKNDPAITKTDPWGQSAQGAAKRMAEISNIFKQEWGVTKWTAQVRPVMAALVAGSSWGEIGLQYLEDHYGGAKNVVTGGLAIGHYVGVINDFAPVDDSTLTLDKLFSWAHNWIDTTLSDWVRLNKTVADKFGVALHSYEGGQAFVASNGMNESLKRQAQDDPRMGDVYRHLVTSWTKLSGGGIWGNFATANQYSQFGYWGLLQSITQTTSVKYEAVKKLITETVAV